MRFWLVMRMPLLKGRYAMTNELTMTEGRALAPVFDLPADQRPALVYLAGLASGSRRAMRQALDVIAHELTGGACDCETCPWAALRFQHTAAIRAILAERYAPATANKMLAALRGVLKAAWRLGQMTAEDYARAADLASVGGGQALPRGRALTAGELRALFGACADDPTPAGRRDAAILAILYGGGLRRAEAAALELGDYDPESGALLIRSGKGRKPRVAYLGGGARAGLGAWLELRGQTPGRLFWPMNQAGQPLPGGLTDQALYDVSKKRGDQARVKDFSPHDLRRSFVSDLLDAGADVVSVQGLAGHANVTTTARYDRRGERARAKAAGLLHVPYEAPKTLTD